jgi:1,4-dihydroxy-6-naphthoate synthase
VTWCLFNGQFDVAKASFHAAALLTDQTVVLPSGSALGFGVGPLLLAAQDETDPNQTTDVPHSVLCPGQHTTASMLFKIFYADAINSGKVSLKQTLFSEIMPELENKQADFGVCIHEGRFTWQDAGLACVEDLGTRWETETESPLPLGGILANRSLDSDLIERIQSGVQASIKWGLDHPEQTIPTMRKYAQEFSDEVLMQHVKLYVNQWTLELGEIGEQALHVLSEKAKSSGIVPPNAVPIEVWKSVG